MPTLDTQFWMALKQSVVVAAGGLPVAWPTDLQFVPPSSGAQRLPYLAVGDVATAARVLIDDAPLARSGVLTLTFVAPLGRSQEWYVERASGLLAYFRPNGIARFQEACVRWGNGTAVPRVERGYMDGGYYRTPIIIPWRSAA